jgi:lysophospholipid acyltransferase (LPLAT)-like uncharacterized protein
LRCAGRFSDNAPVSEKDEGPLRNTIYEQKTLSQRRLTRSRLALYRIIVPAGFAVVRMVWGWCRAERIVGLEHIDAALERSPSFIPVYWHQHQLFCVKVLLAVKGALKLGFLISPSVDGEIGAILVRQMGAQVIRGSSSHTGARALRDYYLALAKKNISPCITPDGPRGPPWKFKPGAILLAQMSQRPIIPMAYAASRAWKIKWDRFIIPMPFSRISVVVGEPVYVPKGLDALALERLQADMEARLKALYSQAVIALSS